jgi:hypothetical protein
VLGPFTYFPFFGLIFVIVGLGTGIMGFIKATKYQEAHAAYQQRRAELVAEQERQW